MGVSVVCCQGSDVNDRMSYCVHDYMSRMLAGFEVNGSILKNETHVAARLMAAFCM